MDVPSGVDALLNYPAATRFAARASRAFFRLASSAAFRAGDIFFFAGAFFNAAFSALWIAAQRFLVAATIAALPAALSFRLGFGASGVAVGVGASDSPRTFAHRSCWAAFMRLRAAAENFFRLTVGASGVAAGSAGPPFSISLNSEIWMSISLF
jgi:hypothetical protein